MDTDSTAVAETEQPAAERANGGEPESGVVVETRNLSKIYRDFWGRKKVHALKSLDIEVRKGEIFGLLGPNGSGKSTTIKLILGLLFPSSGRVLVFDKDASETSKNERIGYLPEESYLYKFLTAEETLDFYGRLFDMSGADRKQRVDELIQLVGLQGAKHRQLREYSKGMTRPSRSGPGIDQRSRPDPAGRADDGAGPDRDAGNEGPDPRPPGSRENDPVVQPSVGRRSGRLRSCRHPLTRGN